MNDNQKNNFFIDTKNDLMHEFSLSEDSQSLCFLIKHNYYSSANEYGRSLLIDYLRSINEITNKEIIIMLVDSAVSLLEDDLAYALISDISAKGRIIICNSSLDFYNVQIPEIDNTSLYSPIDFFNLVIEYNPIII